MTVRSDGKLVAITKHIDVTNQSNSGWEGPQRHLTEHLPKARSSIRSDEGAWSFVMSGLEKLQGWSLHNLCSAARRCPNRDLLSL